MAIRVIDFDDGYTSTTEPTAVSRDSNFRIIDDVDDTKKAGFSVGGITTATTRIITIPDRDLDLDGYDVNDSKFAVVDNADATKKIAFQASGITTATTRTITMPDRDIDLDGGEVSDSKFKIIDNGDNTKKVAFEASGITTATTRTVTLSDYDMTLEEINSSNDATADSTPTRSIAISTGNKTAGTGDSGSIDLTTGTSSGGSVGTISLNEEEHFSATLQTTDATTTTMLAIPTATDKVYSGTYTVCARRSDAVGDTAYYKRAFQFLNNGGTVSQKSVYTIHFFENNASCNATIAIDTTNLDFDVTGIAAQTYEWTLHVHLYTT